MVANRNEQRMMMLPLLFDSDIRIVDDRSSAKIEKNLRALKDVSLSCRGISQSLIHLFRDDQRVLFLTTHKF